MLVADIEEITDGGIIMASKGTYFLLSNLAENSAALPPVTMHDVDARTL